MRRVLEVLALIGIVFGTTAAAAADVQPLQPAVAKKLYELGYPADAGLAVQRWRSDNGRRETGPLMEAETAALLAQPQPEFLAAMVGNPFTGMGLALRHQTREAAEREAIKLCKANGGGSSCVGPTVLRAEQCVAIVGYSVTVERRPTHRTSIAVSTDATRSMNAAREGCPIGASHPGLCRPLLRFCGDGRELEVFDGKQ